MWVGSGMDWTESRGELGHPFQDGLRLDRHLDSVGTPAIEIAVKLARPGLN